MKVLVIATIAALIGASSASGAERVRYNMGWLPQGSQVGVFVALEQGLYAKAGLEVAVTRGYGGLRTVNEVDQGMFDIGYGDPLAVLLSRSHGGRVRFIGVVNQVHPGGLCFIGERRQINRPQDLVGLTVAGGVSSPVQVVLPAWLALNGVAARDVRMIQMDPAVIDAALLTGKVDAVECWRGSNKAVLAVQARRAKLTLRWIEYRQFGVDLYGNGFVASQDLLRKRPATVSAFLVATARGYQIAKQDPRAAVAMMHARFPEVDPAVLDEQIRDITSLLPPGDPVPALGRIDPVRMQRTRDFYVRALGLRAAPQATELYVNKGD